jgi:GNAT superfamily N-acetyltransferase
VSERYQLGIKGIDAHQLEGFFVGWPDPPDLDRHLEILKGSSICVVAIDKNSGQVIGFTTAISDGSFAACIPLLEVLPEYQGRGIGSELVRRILAELEDHYMIDVICDEDVQPFYKRFGLQPWTAMIYRGR